MTTTICRVDALAVGDYLIATAERVAAITVSRRDENIIHIETFTLGEYRQYTWHGATQLLVIAASDVVAA